MRAVFAVSAGVLFTCMLTGAAASPVAADFDDSAWAPATGAITTPTQRRDCYLDASGNLRNQPTNLTRTISAVLPPQALRKGIFSGQVVLGSRSPLHGLHAEIGDLQAARGRIPAGQIEILWPRPTILNDVQPKTPHAPFDNRRTPVGRFEMWREGIQEREARIFVERSLTNDATRVRLDATLAARAQAVVDERTRSVILADEKGANGSMHTSMPGGPLGFDWYAGSGWQDRSAKLYAVAAEVAAALAPPPTP